MSSWSYFHVWGFQRRECVERKEVTQKSRFQECVFSGRHVSSIPFHSCARIYSKFHCHDIFNCKNIFLEIWSWKLCAWSYILFEMSWRRAIRAQSRWTNANGEKFPSMNVFEYGEDWIQRTFLGFCFQLKPQSSLFFFCLQICLWFQLFNVLFSGQSLYLSLYVLFSPVSGLTTLKPSWNSPEIIQSVTFIMHDLRWISRWFQSCQTRYSLTAPQACWFKRICQTSENVENFHSPKRWYSLVNHNGSMQNGTTEWGCGREGQESWQNHQVFLCWVSESSGLNDIIGSLHPHHTFPHHKQPRNSLFLQVYR